MRSRDVETLFPTLLRARPSLAGVYIGREYGTARLPAVAIQRAGGITRAFIDYPALSVNIWAKTDTEANTLAATVVSELQACAGRDPVLTVTPSGPSTVKSEVTGTVQRYLYVNAAVRRDP